jgi:hypothetical protein
MQEVFYSCQTDVLQEAAASYRKAYAYFLAAGDDTRIGRTMTHLASLLLDHVFPLAALCHVPLEDASKVPLFKTSVAPLPGIGTEFIIALESIDNPATVALDIAADTLDFKLLPHSLLNVAELRLLQGDRESAVAYWKECRDLMWAMYMDGPLLILRTCPAYFLAPIVRAIQRLTRLLLCFGRDMINQNLVVLDACVLSQVDLMQVLKRPLRTNYLFNDTPAAPTRAQISAESDEQPFLPSKTPRATPLKPVAPTEVVTPPVAPAVVVVAQQKPAIVSPPLPPSLQTPKGNSLEAPSLPAPTASQQPPSGPAANPSLWNTGKLPQVAVSPAMTPHQEDSAVVYQHELTAEQLWGLIYCVKSNLHKYGFGKLSKNELVTRN